jgi:hypothetical protein
MTDPAEFTEFWVACAAAGPVLLIPTYLMVRQEIGPGSTVRSGVTVGSVAFLAAGTILALVVLSDGTPVHGGLAGRIVELVLIGAPIAALGSTLLRLAGHARRGRDPGPAPKFDEAGLPEI